MSATGHPAGDRAARWMRLLPFVPVLAGLVAALMLATGDDTGRTAPRHVVSDAPSYDSLGGLVAASDLVLVGEVTAVGDGRQISAPLDPAAAFVTELVDVEVEAVLLGTAADTVTVEQIVALADGTEVVVDGQPRSVVGERLLLFLVTGTTDDQPYVALVNGQGRYELSATGGIVGPAHLLPVDWTVADLAELIAGCRARQVC